MLFPASATMVLLQFSLDAEVEMQPGSADKVSLQWMKDKMVQ